MALTISKEKSKTKAKEVAVAQDTLLSLVDEFGMLAEERKILEELPAFKNFDEKKKALLERLDAKFQPEEKGDVKAKQYGVGFTAKRSSSKVVSVGNLKEIRKIVGEDVFMAIIDVSITRLRDYLTAPQFAKLVETEHSGARTVKPYKL